MNIVLLQPKFFKLKLFLNSKKIKDFTLVGALVLLMNMLTFPLQAQMIPTDTPETNPTQTQSSKPMQNNRINYFGIGGAIGLEDAGETTLGDGGFSILGRFSFTNNLSIHSSSIINGDNLLSIAATGGIPIKNQKTERTIVFPFVGGGISADTENFNVYPVIVGGVDVPINLLFTGTMRVNANFGDETDIGLLLGIGIDFRKLF